MTEVNETTEMLAQALSVTKTFLEKIADALDVDDSTCITVRIKKDGETVRDVATVTLAQVLADAEAAIVKVRGETA